MVATTPTQVPKDAVEELVHFLDAKKFRVPSTEEQECDFHYEERCERLFVNQVVRKLVEIHTTVPAQEHVCVFLPTARDVERCGVDFISAYDTLVHSNENQLPVVDFVLLHVHQNTSQLDFTRIFFPTDLNTRKIVLATPDLETCFVGDTIAHIIDSGYGCRTQLNFRSGFEFTTAAPVTQAAAAARASRLSHNRKFRGIVHRMYSETVLAKLAEAAAPAVLHTSVVEMVVCLKAAVAAPVLHIQLRTQPSEVAVVCAFHQLYIANVLARDGRLSTQIRELVSQLSLHPLHGIMLAAATQSGCVHEMACALAWANTTALQLHYTHTLELDECVRVHRIYHTSYLHRGDSKSHYTFRVSSHAPPLRISLCDLQLFHSAVVALETLCQRSSALRTVQLPSHLLPHTPSGTHAPSKLQVCRHIITVVNPLSLASLTHSRVRLPPPLHSRFYLQLLYCHTHRSSTVCTRFDSLRCISAPTTYSTPGCSCSIHRPIQSALHTSAYLPPFPTCSSRVSMFNPQSKMSTPYCIVCAGRMSYSYFRRVLRLCGLYPSGLCPTIPTPSPSPRTSLPLLRPMCVWRAVLLLLVAPTPSTALHRTQIPPPMPKLWRPKSQLLANGSCRGTENVDLWYTAACSSSSYLPARFHGVIDSPLCSKYHRGITHSRGFHCRLDSTT
uniref:Putative ATP-dependent RNA helicase prh1 n=1 Tax=Lygus hesperus TaxID=30085 RepID=A0A0A9Z3A0_LYGHE